MARVINFNLTQKLIPEIVDLIQKEYIEQNKDISSLCFIFGGKRPALFLRRELAKRINKSFIPPKIFSIDEFVDYLLEKKFEILNIKDMESCYLIYTLVKNNFKHILDKRQHFAEFLPWAREILSFIEQLDLEDIKIEDIQNIQLNAQIGYDVPESINKLLSNLVELREIYHKEMVKRKAFTRGLKYLTVSKFQDIELPEFERLFFCNFFYLHKTEERILKYFYEKDKADLIFQADNDWSVMKDLFKRFSVDVALPDNSKLDRSFEILAGFDLHSQVCLVRDVLDKIEKKENTVIVLPKPDHLIPLLSQISSVNQDFNVSLGYSLKRSPIYSLFECIFNAQITKKNNFYYSKDYIRLLSHPLPKNLRLLNNDPSVTRILVHKIEEILLGAEKTQLGGSLFIDVSKIESSREVYDLTQEKMKNMEVIAGIDDLKDILKQLHKILFLNWEDTDNFAKFCKNLGQVLEVLGQKTYLNNYPLNLTILDRLYQVKEEIEASVFVNEQFSLDEMFKIFENKLENEVISFSGSPLKGLQILGLFETRSLSFDNVIVMDMNENSLPLLKIDQPLIPREVMLRLGLNQLEKEEEIQRYQFKRLIASAKKVFLIYQDNPKSEKSRFIEELIWEKQKQKNKIDVVNIVQSNFSVEVTPKKLYVSKKDSEIEFLKTKVFSASSVNTYVECPLKFYYQYVLGLEEKEDLLDEPQARDIGNFIHEFLEDFYGQFLNKKPFIDNTVKNKFFAKFEEKFDKELTQKMKSDSFLLKNIMRFKLEKFLDNEKKRDVKVLLGLETKFEDDIELDDLKVKFQARIDRIDKLADDSIMVVDYKTGIAKTPKDISDLENIELSREFVRDQIKSFQLPLYVHFVKNKFPNSVVNASLYELKELDEKELGLVKLFKTESQLQQSEKIMEMYFKTLNFIMKEIFDKSVNFVADDHLCSRVGMCPYMSICR